jgi:hypothetical protein
MFLNLLKSMTNNDRMFFLGFETASSSNNDDQLSSSKHNINKQDQSKLRIELPNSTGALFELKDITSTWNATSIVSYVESKPTSPAFDRLGLFDVQVLRACYSSIIEDAKRSQGNDELVNALDNGPWLRIYQTLKDYLFLALCDTDCSVDTAAIFSFILYNSSIREKLFQDNKFTGALRLLYPAENTGPTSMQLVLETLFRDTMTNANGSCAVGAHHFLTLFAKNYPVQYVQASNLQRLVKELTAFIN